MNISIIGGIIIIGGGDNANNIADIISIIAIISIIPFTAFSYSLLPILAPLSLILHLLLNNNKHNKEKITANIFDVGANINITTTNISIIYDNANIGTI